jgi:hypothetical protein
MRWPFADTWEDLGGYAGGLWDSLRRETRDTGMRALVTPVEPFNRSRVLAPLVAAAGIVALLMLAGVAAGAIVTAAAALAAIYYLLTQVFGYELTLTVPGAPNASA